MLGFPLAPEMLGQTIDDVRQTLGQGEFLARYACDDGVSGAEGAFVVCSCWLADAELANGRVDAARELIESLLARANDVGLYAEEIDAASGAFLGNFPQALTHLGLIGNIVNLQLAERQGAGALAGSYADRAQTRRRGHLRLARFDRRHETAAPRRPVDLVQALATSVAVMARSHLRADRPLP